MRLCRALLLAALIVAMPFVAGAQFGGMPGLPGGPWTLPPPTQSPAPPPACQQLLTLRDETQKHGMAIQKANERRASVREACRLFNLFLSTETRFINSLEENSQACGVASDAIKRVKEAHAKASQIGKQVCETGDFWWTLPSPGPL